MAADRAERALESGALQPIVTREVVVEDGGIAFSVRVVSSLRAKRDAPRPPGFDPFADPEPALVVVDEWPPSHRVLLNKFPVVPEHLLVVTRDFAPQQAILDEADFDALLAAMSAAPGLAFYNGGEAAGASQPHRHLQLVRTPMVPTGGAFPTEAALDAGALPFPCAVAALPATAAEARATYVELLARIGRSEGPWNLLVTPTRLAVVPRTVEHAAGVSLNALAFAGSLFAHDEATLDRIVRTGPLAMLRAVCPG